MQNIYQILMRQHSDKEQSRQKALELMPSAAKWLQLKRHHGRAEALLLALYGLDTLGML